MTGFDLSTISDIYVGSTQYSKLYYGSTLIWQKTAQTLPYDAEIEYLENSGGYINTEICTTAYPVKLDTEIYPTNSSNERAIMGNSWSGSNGSYVITCGIYNTRFFMWGGSQSWQLASGTAAVNNWYNVQFECPDVNSRTLTIDGTQYTSSYGNGDLINNTSHPLYLMWEGNNSNKKFIGRMKYAKIYIGGTLVRDFIPVRVGQVGYMYDKISRKLFGNDGSGSFICGPEI